MLQANSKLTSTLGYLGLLPFVLALTATQFVELPWELDPMQVFTTYSAIILSFMAGVLWGRGLPVETGKVTKQVLILSNVFSILAWVALVIIPASGYGLVLVLLAAGYFGLWVVERTHRATLFPAETATYHVLRIRLTSAVIVFHGVAIWLVLT